MSRCSSEGKCASPMINFTSPIPFCPIYGYSVTSKLLPIVPCPGPSEVSAIAACKGRGQLKKNVFFRALPELWGGGLPMPEFFGSLFRSAFLVNKKSLFLQKCQYIEILSVF